MNHLDCRTFLALAEQTSLLTWLAKAEPLLRLLEPIPSIGNPLEAYPGRDWEKVYRDQYSYDRTSSVRPAVAEATVGGAGRRGSSRVK